VDTSRRDISTRDAEMRRVAISSAVGDVAVVVIVRGGRDVVAVIVGDVIIIIVKVSSEGGRVVIKVS
jgi:hypothetical protein